MATRIKGHDHIQVRLERNRGGPRSPPRGPKAKGQPLGLTSDEIDQVPAITEPSAYLGKYIRA